MGAPHLGAPKSVRGVVDGDKMGLDPFLSHEEGLMLGRSFGSVPWLFPVHPSEDVAATLPLESVPTVTLRKESALKIVLPAQCLQLRSFIHNRKRLPPSKLRLAIHLGDITCVRTDFVKVTRGGRGFSSLVAEFPETSWLVACPPTLEHTLERFPFIVLHLEEPGTESVPKRRDMLWLFRCVWALLGWVLCCPCSVIWKCGCFIVSGAEAGAAIVSSLLDDVRVMVRTYCAKIALLIPSISYLFRMDRLRAEQ